MSNLPIGDEPVMGHKPKLSNSSDLWDRGWPQSSAEFEMLIDVYVDRLVLSAFRRLGNFHDAEDVVQDVFVRAFTERLKRKKISHIGPYLFKMLLNSCTDLRRRRKRSGVYLETYPVDEIADSQKITSEMAETAEESHRVEEILRQLPKAQAEVIRLRIYDELRLGEIAEVVGCSIDTVRSRLSYGFKKLRKIVSRRYR